MDFFLHVLSIAFPLFLLMDPIGNVPLFIVTLKGFNNQMQRKIIFRELIIALCIIIVFNFAGDYLLSLLHVDQHTILIAGGIILFLISLRMIFPQPTHSEELESKKEPFIVPLAIPFVAGPAVLATVMLYSEREESAFVMLLAIGLAWAASTLILLSSSFLKKILGDKGIIACEKLMGLLLTLIAVQMFLEGTTLYLSERS